MSIYWLNEDSRAFLSRDYLKEGETPEQRIRDISRTAGEILNDPIIARKIEDYLHAGFISLSSPIWSNFGRPRVLPISCNGSYYSDNVDSILLKTAEIGKMSQLGAGTSGYVGALRGRGSPISTGGVADGPVHYLAAPEATIDIISQSNVRRGNGAFYLDIEHPDIMEFLECREEGSHIQHLSLGVCVGREWLRSMKAGDSVKRKIWARLLKKRFETGYPYIFFRDNVNEQKPKVLKDKNIPIHASNLCVAGDTKILTDDGWVEIESVAGSVQNVWNGQEFSPAMVVKTGENQQLLRVSFNNNTHIDTTYYHRFFVQEGYGQTPIEKRANELKPGDKIAKFSLPVIEREDAGYPHPYVSGFMTGDGTHDKYGNPIIWLYGEKNRLFRYLAVAGSRGKEGTTEERGALYYKKGVLMEKYTVPAGSVKERLQWLAGYADADGVIARNGTNESLQISSTNLELLREVRLMLQTVGVESKINNMHDDREAMLPDGKGGYALFECAATYRLLVASNDLQHLVSLGFAPKRLQITVRTPQREARHFVQVASVEEVEGLHDTYCFREPKTGKGMFNGILTGNCSEIALPSSDIWSFVCDLLSLNALHYGEWKSTDLVEVGCLLLDAVMQEYIKKTEGIFLMEAANRFSKDWNAIGMGILGYHSLFQSRMIPFESEEARALNIDIFSTMNHHSLEASYRAARKYGEPRMMEGYGERWLTRHAIAPTTSSSFILGQISPSTEPENSNYYTKDLAKGKFTYRNPYLTKLLESKGMNDEETWRSILLTGGSVQHLDFLDDREKAVFRTFGEISQGEIIRQAADRQPYIDQSQSLNLMIHPDTEVRDVNALILKAEELGIKSLYYQRSTNKAQELIRDLVSCKACEA